MGSMIQRRSDDAFDSKWTPEPFSGCHLWTMAVNNKGYGVTSAGARGKIMLAHRFSWERSEGAIPAGMCVLHHCDTPLCVNRRHLFLGTKQDNTNDMKAKGRADGGEPRVLTMALVLEMRSVHAAEKLTYAAVGARFGVKRQTARSAIVGQSWARV